MRLVRSLLARHPDVEEVELVGDDPETVIPHLPSLRRPALTTRGPATPAALSALARYPFCEHLDGVWLDGSVAFVGRESDPAARVVQALCLRRRQNHEFSRQILRELALVPGDTVDAERWVLGFVAAMLNASDPYPLRRAFHAWHERSGPHRPQPALVLDVLLRLAIT